MGLRISVFDDDPGIRNLLQDALSAKGHEVTTHADPTEFPYLLRGSCPCKPQDICADILIADIVMPNIEGVDFFRQLKNKGCLPLINGNVIIMSGYLTMHYMSELNSLGIHYLRKPFELNAIFDWVEQRENRMMQELSDRG